MRFEDVSDDGEISPERLATAQREEKAAQGLVTNLLQSAGLGPAIMRAWPGSARPDANAGTIP